MKSLTKEIRLYVAATSRHLEFCPGTIDQVIPVRCFLSCSRCLENKIKLLPSETNSHLQLLNKRHWLWVCESLLQFRESNNGWGHNVVLGPWVISSHWVLWKEETFCIQEAWGSVLALTSTVSVTSGKAQGLWFASCQLLMTPAYLKGGHWWLCISHSILWGAKCCQMSGVFYIRKTCIAQDKLISRKLISPWLLRFRMDLDCISSSIFLWMVLLKFWLDFVISQWLLAKKPQKRATTRCEFQAPGRSEKCS